MASFKLIRELLEVPRDKGTKRLLFGLYSANDGEDDSTERRYLALSEQELSSDGQWNSRKRGITVRKGEVQQVIAALQSADFDAKPDGKNLNHQEYAELYCKEW